MTRAQEHRTLDLALVVAFLAAIAAPLTLFDARGTGIVLAAEQRHARQMPALARDPAAVRAFPTSFEGWFADRIGGRGLLIGARHHLRDRVFGVSPVPGVGRGEDGWLFFTAARSLETHRGLNQLSEAELARWERELEARARWLAERGIGYAFVIAPDKESVYPDRLAPALRPPGRSRLDQLAERLARNPSVPFVDVRAALRAEREHDSGEDTVYHREDTHWTTRGAWAAGAEIVRRVELLAATRPPLARTELERHEFDFQGDLARQVSRPGGRAVAWAPRAPRATVLEPEPDAVWSWVSTLEEPAYPRVVVTHDSFGGPLFPWLAEHASRLVAVRGPALPKLAVEEERADLLLQVHTERDLLAPPVELAVEARELDCAAFGGLRSLVRASPGAPLPAGIEPFGTTRIVPTDGGELLLETNLPADTVRFPPFWLSPRQRAAVLVEISAPRATRMSVIYRRNSEPYFPRWNEIVRPLAEGRNTVCFGIEVEDLAELLLRPGLEPGRFVLHRLEVAASTVP